MTCRLCYFKQKGTRLEGPDASLQKHTKRASEIVFVDY